MEAYLTARWMWIRRLWLLWARIRIIWWMKDTSANGLYLQDSQTWSLQREVLSRHSTSFQRSYYLTCVHPYCLTCTNRRMVSGHLWVTFSWSLPQEWASPKAHLLSYPNCFIFPEQGLLEVKHLFCHGVYFLLEALILLKKRERKIIKVERKRQGS